MGILGTGTVYSVANKFQTEMPRANQSKNQELAIFTNSNSYAYTDSFTHSQPTENNQTISENKLNNAIKYIVEEEEKNNKSLIGKFFDSMCNLFVKPAIPVAFPILLPPDILSALKRLHTQASAEMKRAGTDIEKLDKDEKIAYLKILAKHHYGQNDNNEFLKEITNWQKERAAKEVREQPAILRRFSAFIKSHFSSFFKDTGKMNNAAIKVAMNNCSDKVAEELMILYANTLEESRGEILAAALKELPEGLDKETIIKFATTSEYMTTEQINFARDLILQSDLPAEIKARELQKLKEKEAKKHERTLEIVEEYCESIRDRAFRKQKEKINSNNIQYEECCKQQTKINEKINHIKKEKSKFKEEEYSNKKKIKNLKEKAIKDYCKNGEISFKLHSEYDTAKHKKTELKDKIAHLSTKLSAQETEWDSIIQKRSELVSSNFNCIQNMEFIAGATIGDEDIIKELAL